jgi:8-hydroxy-5-deazaflavin:NADPH oxidoreductase
VNIGIVGSGNMGASMGKIWATKGHKVLFSFSTDQEKLRAVAAAAGAAVPEALKAAGDCGGKTLFSCVNCLKPDFSGLEGATSTSAAEEIVKLAHGAKMVEAIPPMAQILAADSRRLDGRQISAFDCGNDPAAKASVASLLPDLDLDPVDVGPLTSARYIEPAGCSAFRWPMAWAWDRSWR